MPDLKELLKDLQETDTLLHSLITEKEEIPAQVTELEDAIKLLHQRFEETREAITNAKKDLKLAELELQSQEELVVKYNTQLYSAKTNEEYKAFLKEIESAEKKKSESEDKIIEVMELIEKEEAELVKREQELKSQEQGKKNEITDVQNSLTDIEKKIKTAKDTYERLRGEIPDDVLDLYDRIRGGKTGIAVAQVMEDNRCSACLNPVPAQKAIEAGHNDGLVFCEYCGRILIP